MFAFNMIVSSYCQDKTKIVLIFLSKLRHYSGWSLCGRKREIISVT